MYVFFPFLLIAHIVTFLLFITSCCVYANRLPVISVSHQSLHECHHRRSAYVSSVVSMFNSKSYITIVIYGDQIFLW